MGRCPYIRNVAVIANLKEYSNGYLHTEPI